MKASQIERALRSIYDAQEEEIPCSEFLEQVSEYVDREIAGEPVSQRMPQVKYHLEHCRVCGDEYEALRDLARLEAEGNAPSIDELKKSL